MSQVSVERHRIFVSVCRIFVSNKDNNENDLSTWCKMKQKIGPSQVISKIMYFISFIRFYVTVFMVYLFGP